MYRISLFGADGSMSRLVHEQARCFSPVTPPLYKTSRLKFDRKCFVRGNRLVFHHFAWFIELSRSFPKECGLPSVRRYVR